jgi:hypothetical protein
VFDLGFAERDRCIMYMRMMNGAEEKLMWELERCFGR